VSPSFRNWAGNQQCQPQALHSPANEDELLSIIDAARSAGQPVKVVGAAHSWSAAPCTTGFLINLNRMNQIHAVDLDTAQITVGAGIRLRTLKEILATHGLALPILGSVAEQSVGGVIATGTHGSSLRHGNMATLVTELCLITADGSRHRLHRDRDGERFGAAVLSLGALGVVTQVTLQCVPAFDLEERSWSLPFEEAVETLPNLIEAHEYIKLWWLPHTKHMQVFTYTRSTEARKPQSNLARWIEAHVVRHVFTLLLWLGAVVPALVPGLNGLIRRVHFRPLFRIDRSDRLFNITMPPIHREMEYAIPIEHTGVALTQLRALIEREHLRVNFPVEARFVAADNLPLSPAYGRDTCQLGAYIRDCPDRAAYFDGFEALMQTLEGRPHWGKEFSLQRADLEKRYPQWETFQILRAEWDPHGMFASAFTAQVLAGSPDARGSQP
jgi:sugar-1,4-lactone oxidase-like protein